MQDKPTSYLAGPDQVRVDSEPVAGGMRLVLPPRPGGLLARVGGVFMLAAVGELLLGCFLLDQIVSRAAKSEGSFLSQGPAIWILAFLLFLPAAVLFVLGALWRWGRTEITCVEGRLQVRGRWRAFALRKRTPDEPVAALEIRPSASVAGQGTDPTRSEDWILVAWYGRSPSIPIVVGYPREWLLRLVEEMRPLLSGPGAAPIPVWDRGDPAAVAAADAVWAEHLPPGSNVECEEFGHELRIHVRPGGWRGPSVAMLGIGLVFTIAGTALAALWVFGVVGRPGRSEGPPPAVLVAFAGVSLLVGTACCMQARTMARRRATLILTPGELKVHVRGGWRSREYCWPRNEVTSVEVGPSQLEVNRRPVPELKVVLASGERRGLLMGMPDATLSWLAARLRRELRR